MSESQKYQITKTQDDGITGSVRVNYAPDQLREHLEQIIQEIATGAVISFKVETV